MKDQTLEARFRGNSSINNVDLYKIVIKLIDL